MSIILRSRIAQLAVQLYCFPMGRLGGRVVLDGMLSQRLVSAGRVAVPQGAGRDHGQRERRVREPGAMRGEGPARGAELGWAAGILRRYF
jgi:hypothetical protein